MWQQAEPQEVHISRTMWLAAATPLSIYLIGEPSLGTRSEPVALGGSPPFAS
jgi:hypothetical protein